MKQMRFLSLFFFSLLLVGFNLDAQEPEYKKFNWDSIPVFQDSIQAEKVFLKKKLQVEFIHEDDVFFEYNLEHIVEQINSEEQVEDNNKKYLPLNESTLLIEAKVRLIKPDSEIVQLTDSDILTAVDENTGTTYKYFAIQGLEKGSIIDYYYVIKKYPSYNGSRKLIQEEFPVMDYEFELYAPTHLDYQFKVYNDTSTVKSDTNFTEKNRWYLTLNHVDSLKYEEDAPYRTLLKQLVYKLDENFASRTKDISSLGTASSNVYNNMFSTDKKDIKSVQSFYKRMKIDKDADAEAKIRAVENYIKDNINIVGSYDPKYATIPNIIKYGSATSNGMVRLFIGVFKVAGIEFQLVLTSDRDNYIFDDEFEAFHYLTDYLLYFPSTKKYIAPEEYDCRYGLIPYELTFNKGLFIKETALGDFKTGIGKVKFIEPLDYKLSSHNINAVINVENDFDLVNIDFTQTATGYYARYIQPYYAMFNEETRKNYIQDNFEGYFPSGNLIDWSIENGEAKYLGVKPFIESYKATVDNLVDKAGNKVVLKIGEVIGHQVELYSETERTMPVMNSYKRAFYRTIEVNLPDGYSIKNPDDLNFDVSYKKDGKTILIFKSTYTLDGNKLVVDIDEYYDQIYFTVDEYEDYRKVVNAAADFEKVVLVIEKEN